MYIKDPKSLVDHVCTVRGLEVDKVIICVGIDGGQRSLKVVMNVFNIEADIDCKESKDTGVNKVLVLALVKNVTENHANLQILIEKTKVNNIKFYLAADLKLLNIIVGLSRHEGKYSCLYCDGEKSNLGELRTFAKLKKLYGSFAENGSKKYSMQLYKNVIHPCLLDEAGDMHVLDVIPPPELHLLIKIVTEILRVLCKEPDIAAWLSNCEIIWHGYNGGGLDEGMLTKFRSFCLTWKNIFDHFPSYHPVVDLSKSFSTGELYIYYI